MFHRYDDKQQFVGSSVQACNRSSVRFTMAVGHFAKIDALSFLA